MEVKCIWEHHGTDSLLYTENFAGAFARGKTVEEALQKCRVKYRAIASGQVWRSGAAAYRITKA